MDITYLIKHVTSSKNFNRELIYNEAYDEFPNSLKAISITHCYGT
jgi:hypothetical protein